MNAARLAITGYALVPAHGDFQLYQDLVENSLEQWRFAVCFPEADGLLRIRRIAASSEESESASEV